MTQIKTPLDLYKHLPKTNCGDCRISTCLAFAAAVIREEKKLADCPHIEKGAASGLAERIARQVNMERIREEQVEMLRRELRSIDLGSRAAAVGGKHDGRSLTITCLGKDFTVDTQGQVVSQCHTHAWFALPLLDYILHSQGIEPKGQWAPLRELENGKTWNPLFEQRCEKPLKTIADAYSDLFGDLVTMFSGTPASRTFDSDISVLLYPFPKVPLLICYWRADEDIASKLHLFFDITAEKNLSIESLFTLGTGLVRMFEKIMHRHTDGKSPLD